MCLYRDGVHALSRPPSQLPINAIQAGDNIKAVSDNLGHYSSAFTMDVYGEASETMRKKSQNIMEELIKQVSNL